MLKERRTEGRTSADEEAGHAGAQSARKAENADDKRDRRANSVTSLFQPPVESLLVQLCSIVLVRLLLVLFRKGLLPPKGSNGGDTAGRIAEGREERRTRRGDLLASGESGADIEVGDEEEDEEDEGGWDEEDGEDGGDDD